MSRFFFLFLKTFFNISCVFLFSRRQYKISQTSKEKNKNTGCFCSYAPDRWTDGWIDGRLDGWRIGWMGKKGLELLLSE